MQNVAIECNECSSLDIMAAQFGTTSAYITPPMAAPPGLSGSAENTAASGRIRIPVRPLWRSLHSSDNRLPRPSPADDRKPGNTGLFTPNICLFSFK